ncbi:hypothetical protein EV715DRAFT_294543 [Schizophyllum commune]
MSHGESPCPAATDVRPPATDVRPPATDVRPPATDVRPPATKKRPPATKKRSRAHKGSFRVNAESSYASKGPSYVGKGSSYATKRLSRAGAGALDSGDDKNDFEHVSCDFEHVSCDDTFDPATTPSISPTPSPISPIPASISPSASSVSPTPSYSPTPSSEFLVSLIDYSSDSSFSIIVSDDLSSERSLSPSGRASSSFSEPPSSPSEPVPSPSEPTPLHSEDSSSQNATLPLSTSMWRWRPTNASDDDSPPYNSHHNLADRYGDFASNHDDRPSSRIDPSSTRSELTYHHGALSSNHHDGALANNPTDLSSSFSAAFARLSLEDDAYDAQAASNARPKRRREPAPRPYLTTASINAINEWLRSVERSPPLAPSEFSPMSPEYPPASSEYPLVPYEHSSASSKRPSGAYSPLWQAASSDPRRQAT